ncbi:hypothetical protein [Maritimibacter sp. UBA3975]|uniref:hypothetical protein n=1 Tax=Maritimibacter sp. UBA3975 TaxID=1946833 RepID=UPI000C0A99CA|nr:hypothetical protein [Maritimibacter sp. UBA3975]MAM60488.1 hypothetical protein [Maritimibacter sp.]|tara:strand:- start:1611 stop:2180 length:570 start_codon:yes stop_codon:yes gene_type:complete
MKIIYASALAFGLATPTMADDAASAMGAFLDENVMSWATAPVLIGAVRAQNAETAALSQSEIDAMDAAWRNEIGQSSRPTIDRVMSSAASDFLRSQVRDSNGAVTEIFIMDSRGLNVAASGVTSDYWQGDEAKHSETFGAGSGARHFSEIEKDESTRTYQGQASLTIVDPESGEPIGAMTVGINAEALF